VFSPKYLAIRTLSGSLWFLGNYDHISRKISSTDYIPEIGTMNLPSKSTTLSSAYKSMIQLPSKTIERSSFVSNELIHHHDSTPTSLVLSNQLPIITNSTYDVLIEINIPLTPFTFKFEMQFDYFSYQARLLNLLLFNFEYKFSISQLHNEVKLLADEESNIETMLNDSVQLTDTTLVTYRPYDTFNNPMVLLEHPCRI